MKKNIFLKITIVAIIIILLVITYFVFFTKNDTLDDIGYLIDLKENVVLDDSIDYLNVYKDNIIDENITSYNYEILHNDASLYGKIYIDNEGYLNITDDFTNSIKKITKEQYTSLYRNIGYTDKLIVYALTTDKKLYKIVLNSSDISNLKYYELHFNSEVVKFTSLNVNTVSSNEISPIVLCNDNKMYVADYGLLYNTNYYEFYNKYIIFDDNTLALTNGKQLVDPQNAKIKVVGYIEFDENIFDKDPAIALITNIGELIYMYSENELYEYNKLIKSLEGQDELKATFYDNTWLKIKGNYYVLNEKTKS